MDWIHQNQVYSCALQFLNASGATFVGHSLALLDIELSPCIDQIFSDHVRWFVNSGCAANPLELWWLPRWSVFAGKHDLTLQPVHIGKFLIMICVANFFFYLADGKGFSSIRRTWSGTCWDRVLALSGYWVAGRARETSSLSYDCFAWSSAWRRVCSECYLRMMFYVIHGAPWSMKRSWFVFQVLAGCLDSDVKRGVQRTNRLSLTWFGDLKDWF